MKQYKYITKSLGYSLLFICMLSLGALEVRAQDVGGGGGSLGESGSRAGTAGAEQLLVPLTARYTALGGSVSSSLSGMSGLEALYANPAGLSTNAGTSALFSRVEYVADIGVNYFVLPRTSATTTSRSRLLHGTSEISRKQQKPHLRFLP